MVVQKDRKFFASWVKKHHRKVAAFELIRCAAELNSATDDMNNTRL